MVKRLLLISACMICGIVPAALGGDQKIEGKARVIDGDTLEVAGQRVRLQGIDAPESAQSCRRANGEPYRCGDQATQELQKRIGTGTSTCCTIESRDRYNRALGICYTADEVDLNAWLVRQGYALAYRHYSTKYVNQEDQARADEAGIWAGEFVAPWSWRRGERLGREPSEKVLREYDDNHDGKITCSEARQKGITLPVERGHPAYPFMRDGDGDGRVCE